MYTFNIFEVFFATIILICIILEISFFVSAQRSIKNKRNICFHNVSTKFAVLIPARYESAVITDLLDSLDKTDYPKDLFHIFVIVESLDDPTVNIVKNYSNCSIFLRKNLNLKSKGYALDECVKDIIASKQQFDAYLVLDADNIVSKNFLKRMNDAYIEGYDLAVGKRDNKYWNSSCISACSSLTFNIVNFINKFKFNQNKTILITGTGFYIKANIMNAEQGWIFRSLTEDYEITNYAVCKGLKTSYVEDAIFKDEQPDSLKVSIIQRSRWVKGFFTVLKKYTPIKRKIRKNKKLSFMDSIRTRLHLTFVFSIIFYVLTVMIYLIFGIIFKKDISGLLIRMISILIFIYLFIVFISLAIFVIEKNNINITRKNIIKAIFFHPIFLFCYIIAAIRAIFLKNGWEKIEHKRKD